MAADLYGILGLSKDATDVEIKKAYRKLAMELHPDKQEGNKDKEERFKQVSDAYSVLSNPEKRSNYDKFGTAQEQMNPEDLFQSMFGGGGGGASFHFNMGGPDIFEHVFGRKERRQAEVIEVPVSICDIYYGKTKKVEFELLEPCSCCNGSGAAGPEHIVKCITCRGQKVIWHAFGPFRQSVACPSCAGQGACIKKACSQCQGKKAMIGKKTFELRLPKGIPKNYEITMQEMGSYDVASERRKDIIFKFRYNIEEPYSIDDHCNVTYTLDVTLEELLGGFQKTIKLYNENTTVGASHYFNPSKAIVLKHKGLHHIKKNITGDLILKINVVYTDSDKYVKYKEVFAKMFRSGAGQPSPSDIDLTA